MSNLTKHASGSLKEAMMVAIPLIVGCLSMSLMTLCDRILVTRAGMDYLIGVLNAGSIHFSFSFAACGIASISAIFVGRFNGAGKYHKVIAPVWQMVYFSLLLSIFFIPVGIFGAELLLPKVAYKNGMGYFQWLFSTAFFSPLISALASFFVGNGDTKQITISVIAANICNVILNCALIFGVPGCFHEFGFNILMDVTIIEPLYGTGAGIATAISGVVQIVVLLCIIFSKKYREKYKVNNYKFNYHIFMNCIKIGFPTSISRFVEMLSWSFLISMFTSYNNIITKILGVSINFFIAFGFIGGSLRDSIATIISNQIGLQDQNQISNSIKSIFILFTIIICCLFIPMLMFPEFSLMLFTGGNAEIFNNKLLYEALSFSFFFILLNIVLSGTNTILCGVIVAGGDTKFIMYTNPISMMLFAVLPIIVLLKLCNISPHFTMVLFLPYRFIVLGLAIWRYKSKKWLKDIEH